MDEGAEFDVDESVSVSQSKPRRKHRKHHRRRGAKDLEEHQKEPEKGSIPKSNSKEGKPITKSSSKEKRLNGESGEPSVSKSSKSKPKRTSLRTSATTGELKPRESTHAKSLRKSATTKSMHRRRSDDEEPSISLSNSFSVEYKSSSRRPGDGAAKGKIHRAYSMRLYRKADSRKFDFYGKLYVYVHECMDVFDEEEASRIQLQAKVDPHSIRVRTQRFKSEVVPYDSHAKFRLFCPINLSGFEKSIELKIVKTGLFSDTVIAQTEIKFSKLIDMRRPGSSRWHALQGPGGERTVTAFGQLKVSCVWIPPLEIQIHEAKQLRQLPGKLLNVYFKVKMGGEKHTTHRTQSGRSPKFEEERYLLNLQDAHRLNLKLDSYRQGLPRNHVSEVMIEAWHSSDFLERNEKLGEVIISVEDIMKTVGGGGGGSWYNLTKDAGYTPCGKVYVTFAKFYDEHKGLKRSSTHADKLQRRSERDKTSAERRNIERWQQSVGVGREAKMDPELHLDD